MVLILILAGVGIWWFLGGGGGFRSQTMCKVPSPPTGGILVPPDNPSRTDHIRQGIDVIRDANFHSISFYIRVAAPGTIKVWLEGTALPARYSATGVPMTVSADGWVTYTPADWSGNIPEPMVMGTITVYMTAMSGQVYWILYSSSLTQELNGCASNGGAYRISGGLPQQFSNPASFWVKEAV